jgi:hypothetical protein
MAFISNGSTVISFAEYQDVLDTDQRLFEANEGLTDEVVENLLIRSTERILELLRSSDWWANLYITKTTSQVALQTRADIPALDIDRIQARYNDFTDLCVYHSMYDKILPKIADFSTEDNAERAKIGFYQQKFDRLFGELISYGDWYNFDGAAGISSDDKMPGVNNLRRVR